MGDSPLLQRQRGGVEDVPIRDGEAQVVKPGAFGVEHVPGGGNGAQSKQDAVGLVDDTAVQLGRVLTNSWVTGVARGLRGDVVEITGLSRSPAACSAPRERE